MHSSNNAHHKEQKHGSEVTQDECTLASHKAIPAEDLLKDKMKTVDADPSKANI